MREVDLMSIKRTLSKRIFLQITKLSIPTLFFFSRTGTRINNRWKYLFILINEKINSNGI